MERFITGYCRALDKSRIVVLEDEDGEVTVDCAWPDCPHKASCKIGKAIEEILE